MEKNPVISGYFKGMAVIQIFKNNSINNCTSISKWIETDQELLNSMISNTKQIKYIETENSGNIIKLYDETKTNVICTYHYNSRHGLYLNNKHTGSVECLNLIEYINEENDLDQLTNNQEDYLNFIERLSEKTDRKSFGSERASIDENPDGFFMFGDKIT